MIPLAFLLSHSRRRILEQPRLVEVAERASEHNTCCPDSALWTPDISSNAAASAFYGEKFIHKSLWSTDYVASIVALATIEH